MSMPFSFWRILIYRNFTEDEPEKHVFNGENMLFKKNNKEWPF